ncbi:MAG: molecular chaperone DnaJ [Clostridiaceae bacterium]|nr:molecular chaperone DnaJ [Clostridiaceae bacterium]
MATKRDYYEVLGVERDADDSTIKKAFWKLAKQYHPDVNPDDKDAEDKFKEANEAYEVLSDSDKRSRYDQVGHAGVDPSAYDGGAAAYNVNLDDLFSTLFGSFGGFGGGFGGFGQQATRRSTGPTRGANLRYRMNLDFMEAAFGVEREISIRKADRCTKCKGKGTADGSAPAVCPVCEGTGQEYTQQQTLFGQVMTTRACSRCGGSGQIIENPCSVCHGEGNVMRDKKLLVTVPAGIDEGEMLTLREEGEPGRNGGPFGDLYIQIFIRPHPVFSREGNRTFSEQPVTYAQAALGSEIEVPTIDGAVLVKLREGTQPGDLYTVRGKGIPYISRPTARGDHQFRVMIEVPRNLSPEQKEMLRAFDESCTDQNYEKRKGFFERVKNAFGTSQTR